jgi:hypothetical protein
MEAKFKKERTSITTVRELFRMFATFPTRLLSHWSLPLKEQECIHKIKTKHFKNIMKNLDGFPLKIVFLILLKLLLLLMYNNVTNLQILKSVPMSVKTI